MTRMTNEELQEIFRMLEESGMNPQYCDTPILCLDASVQAGRLTDSGYVSTEGMAWMPEELVSSSMLMMKVRGESMRDAGFSPGDRIVVEYDTNIVDGDIVVATIDGESTLKSYTIDECGNQWLVPHNPDFEPIRLTEEMTVIRMGKVVQLIKTNPRMGSRELRRIVEQSRRQAYVPGREEVNGALQSIAPSIVNSRLWFAVYRVLVDCRAMEKDTLPKFVQMVKEVVPEHAHLPKAKDLQRLDVLSFSKCVKLWDADDAPVTGKWFDMYCKVARQMEAFL